MGGMEAECAEGTVNVVGMDLGPGVAVVFSVTSVAPSAASAGAPVVAAPSFVGSISAAPSVPCPVAAAVLLVFAAQVDPAQCVVVVLIAAVEFAFAAPSSVIVQAFVGTVAVEVAAVADVSAEVTVAETEMGVVGSWQTERD